MKFLPYEKFIIKTKMDTKSIHNELKESMTPQERFGERVFRGKLSENHFKITPWFILFYNGYMPVLQGKISPHETGSLIKISIRPDFIQISSGIMFLLLIITGFIYELVEIIKSNQASDHGVGNLLMFLAFLVILYIITMVSYKPNISKYKKLMIETLEAEEVIELGLFEKIII